MHPSLSRELWRSAVIVLLGLLVGWWTGALWPALALAALGLLVWQFAMLHGLWRFIIAGDEPPSVPSGMWADIVSHQARLKRINRKRKKRLQKVTRRFQQAAEANPDGAVIVNELDVIEWMSRSAARLLGLRRGQDVGQVITNLMREPEFAAFLSRWDDIEAYELDSPTVEGARLLVRIVPYGNKKRMLIVRDITRLHALEQMRKDFVANVSHELRSPLTVIKGYLETHGSDPDLPDQLRRPMQQMWQQSERMCGLVEDLLRLSRLESEPGGAARQRIIPADMMEAIRDDAAALRPGQHVFELDVSEPLALLGDYNELYSAFSNIVFNAVQYTPRGGQIQIRWSSAEHGGGQLCVSDTGPGIEADHLSRLTERFYRVDKARSRELGGTGLGLAIVKHILLRHDARLEISSEPGVGSTFCCVFPVQRVEVLAPDLAAQG